MLSSIHIGENIEDRFSGEEVLAEPTMQPTGLDHTGLSNSVRILLMIQQTFCIQV